LLASETGSVVTGLVEESLGTVTLTITALQALDAISKANGPMEYLRSNRLPWLIR